MDINVDQFQAMIGHIAPSCPVTFTKNDVPHNKPNHNDHLHLEIFVHNTKIKQVLIDGGARLNLSTLRVVITLDYSENDIDPSRKITIKAYDDEERLSKGVIVLPIRVRPATENIIASLGP